MEILEDIVTDRIQYGTSQTLGVKEGYINFYFDNPSYQNLPADIRERFEAFLAEHF
jgi:basic membrane lipoprotein Med (substrate-binding protein (PBP1-ABC) superfamily)